MSDSKLRALYNIYRGRIEHEDSLVNQRTSWFITLQSFLFTSVALSLSRVSDLFFAKFISILSLVGISISITTIVSVLAAHRAISAVVVKWKDEILVNRDESELFKDDFLDLPTIAGTGLGFLAISRGKISSFLVPFIIIVAWILLLVLIWIDACDLSLNDIWSTKCKVEITEEADFPSFVPPTPGMLGGS